MASLHIMDIDDTLFHTNAKVKVVDHQGKVVQRLSNSEFNDHKLEPHHSYDFSEFRSADKFHDESKPITKMLNKLKAIHGNIKKKAGSKSRVIMNTARADFDDKNKFLDTFRKQNVDIDDIHVHRAGNIEGNEIPAVKKVKIIKRHLESGNYRHAHMYDDSTTNLQHFLAMKKDHPDVEFHAYHVLPDGTTRKFISKPKLEEDAPANSAGGGAIAGIGVGPQGEPGVQPGTQQNILARMLRRKKLEQEEKWSNEYKKSIDCSNPKGFSQKAHCAGRKARQAGRDTKSDPIKEWFIIESTFAGNKVFVVPSDYYHNCKMGKSRYHKYEKYVGNDEIGETIRKYGRDRKNRNKPIIVQDERTGAMTYLRYGGKHRKDHK
jgi:hypothetical protein